MAASIVAVEQFDELFYGDPAEIEQRLSALRQKSLTHADLSLTPQIDSQIALAQAMQGRTALAFATLDQAEQLPGAQQPVAQARLLLERGRVFHQARRMEEALPWMLAAYRVSREARLDFHAINAAHMVAIVSGPVAEKIQWNQTALELAANTADEKAQAWKGVLQNNLGQAYVSAGEFQQALIAFTAFLQWSQDQGNATLVRGAQWGIARAMRSLGRTEEALAMQRQLLREYDEIQHQAALPAELIGMARGMVHEELAELLPSNRAAFAQSALRDLGVNSWFRDLEPARWARLEQLAAGTM